MISSPGSFQGGVRNLSIVRPHMKLVLFTVLLKVLQSVKYRPGDVPHTVCFHNVRQEDTWGRHRPVYKKNVQGTVLHEYVL